MDDSLRDSFGRSVVVGEPGRCLDQLHVLSTRYGVENVVVSCYAPLLADQRALIELIAEAQEHSRASAIGV
jgi:hypothetical protein